jgi:hypothetical protein
MDSVKNSLIAVSSSLKNLADSVEKLSDSISSPAKSKSTAKSASAKPSHGKTKTPAKVKIVNTTSKKTTAIDSVHGFIKRSKKGVTTALLVKKTGFNEKKVQNMVYKLKKQGKIKTEKRGVYSAA